MEAKFKKYDLVYWDNEKHKIFDYGFWFKYKYMVIDLGIDKKSPKYRYLLRSTYPNGKYRYRNTLENELRLVASKSTQTNFKFFQNVKTRITTLSSLFAFWVKS
jgi:hypothetical protein